MDTVTSHLTQSAMTYLLEELQRRDNSTAAATSEDYVLNNLTSVANIDDVDDAAAAGDGRPLRWGVLALFLLIVATIFGNLLVCLAVCWDHRLQAMSNYFLVSLAMADLLVAVLVMPTGMLIELHHGKCDLLVAVLVMPTGMLIELHHGKYMYVVRVARSRCLVQVQNAISSNSFVWQRCLLYAA